VRREHPKHVNLMVIVSTAAMLLALPASESADEAVFSRTGRTLTKFRTTLTDPNVERITVIRMYTEMFGVSVEQLNQWVKQALSQAEKERKKRVQSTIAVIAMFIFLYIFFSFRDRFH